MAGPTFMHHVYVKTDEPDPDTELRRDPRLAQDHRLGRHPARRPPGAGPKFVDTVPYQRNQP